MGQETQEANGKANSEVTHGEVVNQPETREQVAPEVAHGEATPGEQVAHGEADGGVTHAGELLAHGEADGGEAHGGTIEATEKILTRDLKTAGN